ncbi:BGTF surface domain-containing protein [Natronobacterium texcoconense]|uniref:BGTF surface domain-containing protein n=1 Tax=Natronobacterium texcoconense TaxID=1095778 RepID=UPI000B85D9D1|nr:BGTF surface domain-containing protein [Natronobacterium texcoconense]
MSLVAIVALSVIVLLAAVAGGAAADTDPYDDGIAYDLQNNTAGADEPAFEPVGNSDEDTNATDSASIEFVGNVSAESGGTIDIAVSLEHTDRGYVQMVDTEATQFQAVTGFESEDGTVDEAVIQFNTYAPNDGDSWRVHPDYEGDIALTGPQYASAADHDGPLEVGSYGIVTGLQLDDSYRNPVIEAGYDTDTTFFDVTQPTPATGINVSTAPIGEDLEEYDGYQDAPITNRPDVAAGDELLVSVDGFDRAGFVQSLDGKESIGDELADEKISLTIVEQASWWYVEPKVWSTNPADAAEDDVHHVDATAVYTEPNHYDGTLALRLAYDDADEPLEAGGYDLHYEIGENSSLVDETHDFETEFEIVEPTLEWNDSAQEVPNADNTTVTGTTTLAPGSSITTGARSAGTFTDARDAVVEPDGTFTASYDFSEYEAGLEFVLEAYATDRDAYDSPDALEDEIRTVLVSGTYSPVELETDAPSEVEHGDTASIDVTVSNDENRTTDADVTVVIGGEDVEETTISLEGGEQWDDSFEFDTTVEGDVRWAVTAGDLTESGTLTVVEEEQDEEDDIVADDDSVPGGEDDDIDEEATPGFGVTAVIVALLVAGIVARFQRS